MDGLSTQNRKSGFNVKPPSAMLLRVNVCSKTTLTARVSAFKKMGSAEQWFTWRTNVNDRGLSVPLCKMEGLQAWHRQESCTELADSRFMIHDATLWANVATGVYRESVNQQRKVAALVYGRFRAADPASTELASMKSWMMRSNSNLGLDDQSGATSKCDGYEH